MGWCNDPETKKYNKLIHYPFKFNSEKLYRKGFLSGLVATSSITHATPAAFYAHVDNRYKEKEIARLKAALKDAQLERDILKKAISIFSKSDKKSFDL